MDRIGLGYTDEEEVIVDFDGVQLILSREEAEVLFVDLGHLLQDMDIKEK